MGKVHVCRTNFIVRSFAVLLLLGLCAGTGSAGAEDTGEVTEALTWPPPPQEARIRYVQQVAKPEDIGRSKGLWRRFLEFLRGAEDEQMRKPMAIAVTPAGRMVVADPAAKCLHVFDWQEGEYRRLQFAGDEALEFPIAVTTDAAESIYVVDSTRRRVFVLDFEGTLLRQYGEDDALQRPTAVVLDAARGRVYVLDTPAHDIKVFERDSGKLLQRFGERGTEPGQFNYPSHLGIDGSGRLYVTDALNGRIQVLDAQGEFLAQVGQHGDGSGDFSAPKGVAVDSSGHIYVADAAFDNVQVFDTEGRLLLFFGSSGQEPGQFWMPAGLVIDSSDRIYVADTYNKRIQVFQYINVEAQP